MESTPIPENGTDELELLTIGRISIDLYCEQIGADWHAAQSFSKAVGGSPTNVAIAAARLGHRAAVYTKVGDDPFGEVAIEELRAFGVDTRYVGIASGRPTPLAFAALDRPADPALHFRREPPVPDLQLNSGEVGLEVAATVPVLWVSAGALSADPSAGTTEELLHARRRARHTILDLDYRPSFWTSRAAASERIGAAISDVTVAVGNREECAVAVGTAEPDDAAERLLERGVELAIVKLGADGVLVASARARHLIPPAPITVFCGLGAGDAFGGALCHGLLSGWDAVRTVTFANAAGGIVASRLLCSAAMPHEHEVLELLEASGAREPA